MKASQLRFLGTSSYIYSLALLIYANASQKPLQLPITAALVGPLHPPLLKRLRWLNSCSRPACRSG